VNHIVIGAKLELEHLAKVLATTSNIADDFNRGNLLSALSARWHVFLISTDQIGVHLLLPPLALPCGGIIVCVNGAGYEIMLDVFDLIS